MAGAGITTGTGRPGHDLLGIYLNDHLAGATGDLELARRVAGSHRRPAADGASQRLAADVSQDRAALEDMLGALGIPVRACKVCTAWIGEKASRLKLNDYVLTRSPLSSLEELEMLRLGVEGMAAGWRTLRVLAETDKRLDPRRLDELIARARRQADFSKSSACMPQTRSSAMGRQPVTHERYRRDVIFGVDSGVADGVGLAGGGRIDDTKNWGR